MKKNYLKGRNNICKWVIVIAVVILYASLVLAGSNDASDQKIKEKKAAIIKIMNQGKFKAYIQKDTKFCSAFLNDFIEQKQIEHIQPILEVEDYNDPKLQVYFKQCPNKKFNGAIVMSARAAEEIEDMEKTLGRKLTDEELEKEIGGPNYYATKSFKLFKVNLDNDFNNGDEFVFYAEGYRSPVRGKYVTEYTYGGYEILDLKNCKTKYGASTRDPYDYEKQQPIENYNGIIKYKGAYYVFDLYDETGRRLVLKKYNKKRGNMNSVCEYRLQK